MTTATAADIEPRKVCVRRAQLTTEHLSRPGGAGAFVSAGRGQQCDRQHRQYLKHITHVALAYMLVIAIL